MAGQKKVVDASIGVKWFSEEDGSAKAFALLEQHVQGEAAIMVPDLFYYEVLNALRYKKISRELLLQCAQDLWSFQLERIPISPELAAAICQTALDKNLSFYDAVYLSLAQQTGQPCISSDKSMLEKGAVQPLI